MIQCSQALACYAPENIDSFANLQQRTGDLSFVLHEHVKDSQGMDGPRNYLALVAFEDGIVFTILPRLPATEC